MVVRKPQWIEIGRIVAILCDAIGGALDRICERYERRSPGYVPEVPSQEETDLRKQLQEDYND